MAWENFKYIVSASGGIGSAVSAMLAAEHGHNYEMVFADTLIEDEDLYRFLDDVSNFLGKPYVHLKDGRDPWEVFIDRLFIGNSRTAHCSRILKTEQVANWMKLNCKPKDGLVLGMYRDEEDRLIRAKRSWFPRPVSSLLMTYKITPGKAAKMLASAGIKQPRLYDMGFPHNNCGGMCVRAGQGQFATLLKRKREFYLEQEEKMERAMLAIGPTARPFIRVTFDYGLDYVTMRQFRILVESGKLKPKLYEMGGCGCFVDD